MDKAYKLIYGGRDIFPNQKDIEKALTLKIEVEVAEALKDQFSKDQIKNTTFSNRLKSLQFNLTQNTSMPQRHLIPKEHNKNFAPIDQNCS